LGLVDITDEPAEFIRLKGLGPDAMDLGPGQFDETLGARRGYIKSLLMNQHAIAGLGNVYSDEILFQAGIHPRCEVRQLSGAERHRLRRALNKVLHEAIEDGADPQRFPRTFLTPHRHPGAVCPRCGTKLGILKVGGRTSYYCPRRQPPP
ncbi:MAG: Fpg/Nei family DNA glycosylase, partial [Gammaproteobacteria bacterium]